MNTYKFANIDELNYWVTINQLDATEKLAEIVVNWNCDIVISELWLNKLLCIAGTKEEVKDTITYAVNYCNMLFYREIKVS